MARDNDASVAELTDAWRRVLRHLVPPDRIVATASLGATNPEWQRLFDLSYPETTALVALAEAPELKAAMRAAGIGAGMRVLDAACGPGVISRFLLDVGAREVIGVDFSAAMLALARAVPLLTPSGASLRFLEGDLRQPLPFPDDSFDAVWMGDQWLPEALPELRRVTRPGGRIVFKIGGLAPGLMYAWDPGFNARIHAAFRAGLAARGLGHETGLARSMLGYAWGPQRAQNFYHGLKQFGLGRLWTVNVERLTPVPPIWETYLCQFFALWQGGHLNEQADPAD